MILTANETRELHPDGIFPAVCVDVIDLGLVEGDWKGEKRMTRKVRVVWETVGENDTVRVLSRTYTASLSVKAKLSEMLGAWRGRPIAAGESVDLERLKGVAATLVVGHVAGREPGSTFAAVEAVSRPTRKVQPSGKYDPADARAKLVEKGYKLGGNAPAAVADDEGGIDPGF